MTSMPLKAKVFVSSLVALVGLAVLTFGVSHWQSQDLTRYLCYFFLAMGASCLKVRLPGITGTMSVNFLFILIGILELSFSETLALGCCATLVQCFWHVKARPKAVQILFNLANMATAIAVSYFAFHSLLAAKLYLRLPVLLASAAIIFFVMNTVPVAAIISLTEGKPLKKTWEECYFWCFPYYLVGAAIAGLLSTLNRLIGWQSSLLVLPVVYWIYRSYHLYLARLESEKRHSEEMSDLHLRTIEALALAIEAKDHTTYRHLQRVQTYSVGLAKELGLDSTELDALRAAALLHDIGKLAVPEHIISKPGKLTPEEFEKMKIHPVVGAEILGPVKFPYPVVPIVRAHHEKWDGTGYPYGLKGEEIPMGARILAAVDCLDSLASDRQYRAALPLHEAMNHVAAEAGKSFDARVVEALKGRYAELERSAQAQKADGLTLSREMKIERGVAPAAGFETTSPSRAQTSSVDFLSSIAAARQEVQILFELTHALGNSLSLDDTLSVLGVRLKRMIPYDAIVIYLLRNNKLVPEYVNGENFRLFSSLEIPLGEGLVGWVAQNVKAILNGNPSVERGYPHDPVKASILQSALAVPLEGLNGVAGVIGLYHMEKDAFTKDHLRILLAITPKVAMSIENALKYRLAESSATTDYLTGLPNARSLFLHLDSEVARCKRQSAPLSVLVCDLDGFKQINDRLGHLEGNRVLQMVAKGLKVVCREYDYAGRLGGDEFVAVFPGLKREAARAMSQRLRHVAAEVGRQLADNVLLSLSVGEAFYPEDGADADQLLAQADRRMYTVKQQQHAQAESRPRLYVGGEPATTQ
jgi:diguanylate cyclase (GGDEF)-like protein/putative nucleotidyltransferase with HDIG domain